MRRLAVLIAVLFLAGITHASRVDAAGPRVVTVKPGKRVVRVDGAPFVFKGFNYIGSAIPDRWPPISFAEDLEACQNDAALMAGAGVTAIRVWWTLAAVSTPQMETECLDRLWERGIGVVWTILPPSVSAPNSAEYMETFKVVIDEALRRFAQHPATLVWLLGNELDLGSCAQLPGCLDDLFGVKGGQVGLLNTVLEYTKSKDSNHLVGTTVCCPLNRMNRANLPALDIWSMNHYPVLHTPTGRANFEALLSSIGTWDVTRPKIFTEQGTDRYWCRTRFPALPGVGCQTVAGGEPPVSSGEYQPSQAEFHATAWDMIEQHLADGSDGAVSGSTTFTYADMWNRCALFCLGASSPATHEVWSEAGIANAPDGTFNSGEWWGVTHAIPRGASYTRPTTLAFDALAQRWSRVPPPTITAAPEITPRQSPCQYEDDEQFRFRARWSTSRPATSEVYVSFQGQVLNDGGDAIADNSIYQPAVTNNEAVTDHDVTFTIPWGGRGKVIVRSFTPQGQSVTWPPIVVRCGDL